jgi:CTP:molybdopterin cytidylyltransferase MocA
VIAGVVLAAGAGVRIGHPKALLRMGEEPESFVERACRVLRGAGIEEILVVAAPDIGETVRRLVPGARVLVNASPSGGQLSSLQVAIAAVSATTEAIAVLPVDVPKVRADTIRALVAAWTRTRLPVVRPAREGRHGHPVVLSRCLFAELSATPLAEGAKPVVRRHATPDGDVETADEGAFVDVDTAGDYERVFGTPVRTR